MVDRQTFSRRLAALERYLTKRRRLGAVSETEFLRDPAVHDLAERYLHLETEACLDLANHWIADRGLRAPETNRDAFTVLEQAGEIDPGLAERMRGWAGFRNVLVHEYIAIDHAVSYRAIVNELGDLENFARWASARLES